MVILIILGILIFVYLVIYFGIVVPEKAIEKRLRAEREKREAEFKKLLKNGIPREWRLFLGKKWPIYNRLPPEIKEKLHKKIIEFYSTKVFKGKEGLEVTQEMKLLISSLASILVLEKKECYPHLKKVEIYPGALSSNVVGNSSMSPFRKGVIRISWKATKFGALITNDSYNVVIHECAHQLDQVDLQTDGIPYISDELKKEGWAGLFREEYKNFISSKNIENIISDYGKTSIVEFFACSTESFFEQPKKLQNRYPNLYELLRKFYTIDPLNLYMDS